MPRMPGLIRILSDLHFQDGDSRLQTPEQLEPLLRGVEHLVLNGDTLDTQRTPNGDQEAERLAAWLRQRVSKLTLVTGNHDPAISTVHEVSLVDGRVWVFHGDLMYEAVAPWSAISGKLRREIKRARLQAGVTADSSFEQLAQVHRRICREIHVEFDVTRRDLLYRCWRTARMLLPPTLILRMFRVWRTMPAESLRFAARHQRRARFVITGHCHAPSLFEEKGQVAINTGSFCRPRGAFCVDIADNALLVRPLLFAQDGPVSAGEPLARFSLSND